MNDNGKPTDEVEDVLLMPQGPTSQSTPSQNRETALLTGQPVQVIETPQGKKLPIYPKPQGYFYRIEEAVNVYIQALLTYDARAQGVQWPQFWWQQKRKRDIDRIEKAKFNLLRLIFEDKYNAERHTELSENDFLALPHDCVLQILDAYREANHVEDILRRLIPDWDKKKVTEEAMPSFTRM